MVKHTPTPWTAEGYYFSAKVPTGRPNGEVIGDTMPSVQRLYSMIPKEANTSRLVACVNAFHDPKRTIATEQISEGLVFRMYDLLLILKASPPDRATGEVVGELLRSLKVEKSDA